MYNTNESEFMVPLVVGASVSPNGIGGNETASGGRLGAATDILLLYVPPVLLVLGLLGNCFCIIVLNSKRMRQSRCCFPLTALACVDISVLLIGLLRLWLTRLVGFDVRLLSVASCKIHTYLSYVSRHLSSWTLMVLAVERMVSVYSPLKAKHWCSKRRTSLSWLSVVAIICLVNTPLLFLKDLGPVVYYLEEGGNITVTSCEYTLGKAVHYAVWSADAALLCCIPFIVICASNVMILSKTVCCMDKNLHRTLSNNRKTRLGLSQMTFMLLLVCFVFLVCTTPIMVFFLMGARFWEVQEQTVVNFAYSLCNLIYYCNSVCNFALYCLGGSQFRQTAKQVFCGRCSRGRDEVGAVNGIDMDGETSISMFRRKSSAMLSRFSLRTKSIESDRTTGIRQALRGSV